MKIRKLRGFGHIMRPGGFDKDILLGPLEGRQHQGRPSISWINDINPRDDGGSCCKGSITQRDTEGSGVHSGGEAANILQITFSSLCFLFIICLYF